MEGRWTASVDVGQSDVAGGRCPALPVVGSPSTASVTQRRSNGCGHLSSRQTIASVERFVEGHYHSPSHLLPHPLATALESSALHGHDHIHFVNGPWMRAHPSFAGVVGIMTILADPPPGRAIVEVFVRAGTACLTGTMEEQSKGRHVASRWAVGPDAWSRGLCPVPGPSVLHVVSSG